MTRMRRTLIAIVVAGMAALGIVGLSGSPAFAGTTACATAGGTWSWNSYSFSITGVHHVEIDVYKGTTCGGNYILAGTVETQGNGHYNVVAQDNSCDNIGMRVELHGYSIGTTGCGTSHNSVPEPTFASIGSPKNFWLYINSTSNTSAYNLPTEA